jgi:hypothetical protein
MADPVNHPDHYNAVPGIECIDVVKYLGFVVGNAMKYLWRCGKKPSASKLEDLRKARWYIDYAIAEEEEALASTKGRLR